MGKKDWQRKDELPATKQPSAPEAPERWGYGMARTASGEWVCYRVSNAGKYEALTPLRHGIPEEDRARCTVRLRECIEREFLPERGFAGVG